ncbi:MAG: hypothetical protein ACLFUZ_01945 [Candidatus Micrarchaeia archaeon]
MNIQNIMRSMLFGLVLFGLLAATEPADPTVETIESGICELYYTVQSLLAVVVFVLVVVAAIVYAAGQVMGAETRARASVWATSMIVGAIIGLVIYIIVPLILGTMMGGMDLNSVCGESEWGGD